MKKKFIHVDDINDVDVPQRTTQNGKRVYLTPGGKHYPSITSIIGSQPKPSLVEWRERVGVEEANRVIKEATTLGTAVHLLCERYLYNYELRSNVDGHVGIDDEAMSIFNRIRFLLGNINQIVGLEIPLYSDILKVAGTTDCVAEYNGVLSVIDFKTSKKEKKEEWIEDYFIQCSAYAAMFEEHTDIAVDDIVIMMVAEDGSIQIYEKKTKDYLSKLAGMMAQFYADIVVEEKNL